MVWYGTDSSFSLIGYQCASLQGRAVQGKSKKKKKKKNGSQVGKKGQACWSWRLQARGRQGMKRRKAGGKRRANMGKSSQTPPPWSEKKFRFPSERTFFRTGQWLNPPKTLGEAQASAAFDQIRNSRLRREYSVWRWALSSGTRPRLEAQGLPDADVGARGRQDVSTQSAKSKLSQSGMDADEQAPIG